MNIKEVKSQAELLEENKELKKKIAKLERIIERLVRDASFNACQPSQNRK